MTSSLDIKWTFDDGGTATGKNVSHTFAENFLGGVPHSGTVVITDPTGLKTTLPFLVPVADAPISLSCATPWVSLQAFSGTVANLTDGDPAAPLSDFTATINWGDSSSSAGTVSGSGGNYLVAGSHTYTSTGFFDVTVHVDDVGGSTADTASPCTVLVFAFAPGGGSFAIGDKRPRQRHGGHLLGRPVGEAELLERRRRAVVLQGLCQEPRPRRRAVPAGAPTRATARRPRQDRCPPTWA